MYVHTPVLLEPVLTLLEPGEGEQLLIDATLGEGGHAEGFLTRYPRLRLCGIEKDAGILEIAGRRLARFGDRVRLVRACFSEFFEEYDRYGERPPDRILFDLGISMYHFEKSGRGFSFSRDEPLDMRIDPEGGRTAGEIVNESSQEELAELLRRYGEEPMAGPISRAILRARAKAAITTARALAEVVWSAVPPSRRYGRIHPATRTFQALRISVNRELEVLSAALEHAFAVLASGGRLGVIAFHSLEDRIVKRFFQERNKACTCPPDWPICQCGGQRTLRTLTRKPVCADPQEKESNPAARSAKLRVAEKLA
ncbi:MAG: 16S rRNA (cytosine(1402)-N(4))-methyltransferase RsmH [Spirochaetales bacterium]|nr:16S rRNA (cytosine(1402)-N(4))-methyltransferase RsmH [Spirochaetales bacterium]